MCVICLQGYREREGGGPCPYQSLTWTMLKRYNLAIKTHALCTSNPTQALPLIFPSISHLSFYSSVYPKELASSLEQMMEELEQPTTSSKDKKKKKKKKKLFRMIINKFVHKQVKKEAGILLFFTVLLIHVHR